MGGVPLVQTQNVRASETWAPSLSPRRTDKKGTDTSRGRRTLHHKTKRPRGRPYWDRRRGAALQLYTFQKSTAKQHKKSAELSVP